MKDGKAESDHKEEKGSGNGPRRLFASISEEKNRLAKQKNGLGESTPRYLLTSCLK